HSAPQRSVAQPHAAAPVQVGGGATQRWPVAKGTQPGPEPHAAERVPAGQAPPSPRGWHDPVIVVSTHSSPAAQRVVPQRVPGPSVDASGAETPASRQYELDV